jgi:FixJ family two-component response regulator
MTKRSLVCIVDDSESVRDALFDLLQYSGYDVQAFDSAEAFLGATTVGESDCLILDVGLPGMSGPDLQLELTRQRRDLPIVFITAQAEPALPSGLIAGGAVACFLKPFSDTALLAAIATAVGER